MERQILWPEAITALYSARMAPLIQLRDIALTFGGTPLLTSADLRFRRASGCAWSAATVPANRRF